MFKNSVMMESIEKLSRAIIIPNRARYNQSSPICAMLVRRPLMGDRLAALLWCIRRPLVFEASADGPVGAALEVS